jgi:hypothetical protein
MDTVTAARLLNVAEAEILEVRQDGDGWWALQEDMANHDRNWRPLDPAMNAGWWETPHPSLVIDPVQAPVDDPEPAGGDTDGDGVPTGAAGQILEWVGSDKARAGQALSVEQASDKPRSTLVAALQKVITS